MKKSEATRKRILRKALYLLPEEGLGGLSIGRLAEETNMSKSGLFARFGSQDALQVAIIDAAVDRFQADVVRPARAASGSLAKLEALAQNWVEWLTDDPDMPCPLIQAAFEAPGLTKDAAEKARTTRKGWIEYIERLTSLAIQEGSLRSNTDPGRFANFFDGIGLAAQSAATHARRENARSIAERAFADLFVAYKA